MLKVVLFLSLAFHCVVSYCDEGWEEYNGSCYGFSPEVLDWYRAAFACQLYGARLVQIGSKAENDWIVGQLKARKIGDAWAGGSNRYHNSKWEWVPGLRPFSGGYTNWNKGEPNNLASSNPSNPTNAEQCLQFRAGFYHLWNDYVCTAESHFVCEKRACNDV